MFARLATLLVHVDRLGPQRLAACKGEQPGGQVGAPLGGVERGVDQPALRLAEGAAEQYFEIADDRHQQVVEIVRQTAGQLADGFHFLCLKQRLFGAAQRGQISCCAEDLADGTGVVDDRHQHCAPHHLTNRSHAGHLVFDQLPALGALAIFCCQFA